MRNIMAPMKMVTKIWESETEPTMPRFGIEIFNLKEKFHKMIVKETDFYLESN